MHTVTLSRAEVAMSDSLPADLRAKALRILAELPNWRSSPTDWGHVAALLAALRTACEAGLAADADVLTDSLATLRPAAGLEPAPDAVPLPADLREPLAELVRVLKDDGDRSAERAPASRPRPLDALRQRILETFSGRLGTNRLGRG